ncbi:glucose-6-phosphate 1-epimerase [Kwoniella mangroviensis CBS 10435]|uniref:Glucose-6-phosphate 1-epimerase n=1 Tax=Kwoniella mangroviensis CBS 10435 TaxID=1331196 RepID=A0A1B9IVH6_9TREE|nr:glucose-6-phosphate 1-epimerase [Kwoniella mangroviensis CBS 8507]OCF59539.1 glucose-6-phosphate 1-epimerase [Kwoniella mangroviensis CBS 10435]OCF66301.1 glucose-6-phosphate 1-epimerase [Kwoniella mangroviensis CBS 8507]OCF73438.1 glucose-6-phosphate 1-epimerase [Kwoniella mangroviensis CBS 8886]
MGVTETDKSVIINHESGSSAEIYLYGATIVSWKSAGKERLFVSGKAALDGSKAIRGGIPICFPIFGPPPSSPPEYASLSQHGFARNQIWKFEKTVMDRPEGVSLRFTAPLPPTEFQHKYKLAYVVTLSEHQLSTDLHIVNEEESKEFTFQALLHTYLAIPDSSKIKISNVPKGTTYVDKILGGKKVESDGEDIVIDRPIDRVYHKVASQEVHVDDGFGGGYKVRFRGFEDCTIWNPTEETGKKIVDMEDKGWEKYICIEPGYAREFKSLAPGEEFIGQQVITAL